ncbi:MAG: MBL fold metallo-hydrolase, partial [Cyclonatronaceae bacterium]
PTMITRRQFLGISTFAAGSALLPAPLKALMMQSDRFRALRGDVGIYVNRGGTIAWLNNSNALAVVDTQYPDTAMDCLNGLYRQNERMIDAVLNTHHHGDHTGGNGVFRPYTREILAHANVPGLKRAAAERQGSLNRQVYPDHVYRSSHTMDAGGETIHLRHYGPAHTGGDSVIAFDKANVVHMGDLMFNGLYPFIDIDGGASVRGWIHTLRSVAGDFGSDTIYVFGHAGAGSEITGSSRDLDAFRAYLEALHAYVESGMEAGKSLDELKTAESLPGFESMQGAGTFLSLAANVEAAWRDLNR